MKKTNQKSNEEPEEPNGSQSSENFEDRIFPDPMPVLLCLPPNPSERPFRSLRNPLLVILGYYLQRGLNCVSQYKHLLLQVCQIPDDLLLHLVSFANKPGARASSRSRLAVKVRGDFLAVLPCSSSIGPAIKAETQASSLCSRQTPPVFAGMIAPGGPAYMS